MSVPQSPQPFPFDVPENVDDVLPLLERLSLQLRIWADVLDLTLGEIDAFEAERNQFVRAAKRVQDAEQELQKRRRELESLRSDAASGLPAEIAAALRRIAAHPEFSDELLRELGLVRTVAPGE